jgi:hypothetical protein
MDILEILVVMEYYYQYEFVSKIEKGFRTGFVIISKDGFWKGLR